MTDARTGTRWGRTSGLMAVAVTVLLGLAAMVWTNAFGLDARIVVQGSPTSFATRQIVADDVGFGMTAVRRSDGSWDNVLRAGFAQATLNGLCVSKTEKVAGFDAVTIRLTAGDGEPGSNEIRMENAAFDITDLRAQGAGIQLQGSVQIGLATPDITTVPGAPPFVPNPLGHSGAQPGLLSTFEPGVFSPDSAGINGGFTNGQGWTGIDATRGTLTTIYGTLWQAQITGNIALPGLSITITPGTGSSCEAEARAGRFPQ